MKIVIWMSNTVFLYQIVHLPLLFRGEIDLPVDVEQLFQVVDLLLQLLDLAVFVGSHCIEEKIQRNEVFQTELLKKQ